MGFTLHTEAVFRRSSVKEILLKALVKKTLLNFKITSHTGQQIITTHILPDISKSNGNQTVTFGQLI